MSVCSAGNHEADAGAHDAAGVPGILSSADSPQGAQTDLSCSLLQPLKASMPLPRSTVTSDYIVSMLLQHVRAGTRQPDCGADPGGIHSAAGGQVPPQHPSVDRGSPSAHHRQPHLVLLRCKTHWKAPMLIAIPVRAFVIRHMLMTSN